MPYLDISDATMKKLIKDYIDDMSSTEQMEKLTMSCLKSLTLFDEADWSGIKKLVDKQYQHQIDSYGE